MISSPVFSILVFLHQDRLLNCWTVVILCQGSPCKPLAHSPLAVLGSVAHFQPVSRYWSRVLYSSRPLCGRRVLLPKRFGASLWRTRLSVPRLALWQPFRLVARTSIIFPQSWRGTRGHFGALCDRPKQYDNNPHHLQNRSTIIAVLLSCNSGVFFAR